MAMYALRQCERGDMGILRESGLTLKMSEDGRHLIAIFEPSQAIGAVDRSLLKSELTEQFPGLFYFEDTLPELAQKIRDGEAFEKTVGEVRDGEVLVNLDADKMTAYLSITPAFGGKPATREQVAAAIKADGITSGIDSKIIEQTIMAGQGNHVVFARGRHPKSGDNGRIEFLIPEMKERTPCLDENGMVDFRNLGEVLTVQPGEALARRIPPTEGIPGENVLGQTMPAKSGKDVKFAGGLGGTAADTSDPDVLLATIIGQPVQVKNGVFVEPTYAVAQVDMSTGNIVYDGTVKVKGDVLSGMTIRATGDINIAGTVEAASEGGIVLEAGGDIVVMGGVIGRIDAGDEESRMSRIHCKGSFTARFVQNVNIYAENSIYVDDTAMQSELSAGNEIVVGKRGSSGKGRIIGGQVVATMLVKAQVIGCPSLTRTVVEVGFHHLMQERLRRLTSEQQEMEKKQEEVQKVLNFYSLNPGKISATDKTKAEKTLASLQTSIAVVKDECEALNRQRQKVDKCRVVVERTLYEGVEVVSGGQRYKTKTEQGSGVFVLRNGELEYGDLPR